MSAPSPASGHARATLRLLMAEHMLDGGALDAAESTIDALLDADPTSPQATMLRAEAHLRRGRHAEARDDYASLLSLMDPGDPSYERVGAGLGAALHGAGDLDAAAVRLADAVDQGLRDDRSWILLAYTLLSLGRRADLAALADRARASAALDPLVADAITTLSAIAAYVDNEPALCRLALADAKTRQPGAGHGFGGLLRWRRVIEARLGRRVSYGQRPVLAALALRDHLGALLNYRTDHLDQYDGREDGILHLVGDSHCLAPAHTHVAIGGQRVRVVPHLLFGAKAWHLAPGESPATNPHRTSLTRVAAALPDQAVVAAMFGETDCRADEGISRHLKAHPSLQPGDYCRQLAENYVGHVAATFAGPERGVMIHGVPAPTQRAVAPAGRGRADLIALAKLFNRCLAAAASAHGLPFLDPYPATADDRGLGNGRWHMDDHHLSPDLFRTLVEAADAASD